MVADSFAPRRFHPDDAAGWIHLPTPEDDKYQRGVVGMRTGSNEYPGAAVLGVSAAWHAGAGMVRYQQIDSPEVPRFGLPTPAAAVLAVRPETVFGTGRSDAWVVGSGSTDRTIAQTHALESLLDGPDPVVLDAGALDLARASKAPLILTPHWGEFRRLWRHAGYADWPSDEAPNLATRGSGALRLAHIFDAVILLKGSETVVASPTGDVWVVGPNSPYLATAGSGDVLAGLLGALLATAVKHHLKLRPGDFARITATAALAHSRAAAFNGHSVTALEISEALPTALKSLAPPNE